MVIKEATGGETMASNSTTDATKPTTNKTVIIAQEIKFARALAGNDPKLRRKVLKNLKTWLTTRSQSTFAFSDADFLRLWKGLFYCMWMSDKPLVQEELAESVGMLVRCFDQNVPVAVQFFKAFMVTMGIEWFGIDRWRMDKFMMFVRRVTRQLLFVLHENGWQTEHVGLFVQTIEATVLNRDVSSFGLTNHFNDLLLEEIAKVSDGTVPKEVVTQIVEPYVRYMLKNDDPTVISGVVKTMFHSLMQQSELGQMYEEKFDLWKRANFITGDIDNVQFNVEYKYGEEAGKDEDEEDGTDEEEEEEEENGQQPEKGEEEEGEDGEQGEDANDAQDDGDEDDDDGEEEEDGEGTEKGKVYDPRAGRVSVEIPQIEFDPLEIVALFEKHRFKSYVTSRGKKSAIILVRKLTKFASGAYPLGIKHVPSINPKDYAVDIDEQVHELEDFRKDLYGDKPKNWKDLKKEKQRQRKLLREQREAKMAKQAARMVPNGGTCTKPDDTPGETTEAEQNTNTTTVTEQDADSGAPAESVEKKATSKKKRLRKKNPALVKKQMKLELLKKKKQAKLLLLKERLKRLKKTEPTANGSSEPGREENEQVSPAGTKQQQPKRAAGKKESPTVSAKKKAQTKDKTASKKNGKPFQTVDEWSEPLQEGEEEYFIPSRKMKSKAISPSSPVSAAKPSLKRTPPTPAEGPSSDTDPITPARKRVKIALNKNVAQDLVEHIEQVKSSPQLPFDSSRKPSKSLLKPNLIPSPINPFYKKKIGLK
uniref:Uncharacterized protein n=1 Tax=Anopheles atroparvus TaxID=41427 RepID=A0AAG5CY59_ANOAO